MYKNLWYLLCLLPVLGKDIRTTILIARVEFNIIVSKHNWIWCSNLLESNDIWFVNHFDAAVSFPFYWLFTNTVTSFSSIVHIHNKKLKNKSKNFTSGVNSISLLTMATLSMNSSDFNEALTSFKTFVEAIFSGQDKSQKLRLCGMMKNLSIPTMINILPPELLEKIFKLLNFKDTCQANLVCRRWNEIIVNGNVLKKSSGKTSTK